MAAHDIEARPRELSGFFAGEDPPLAEKGFREAGPGRDDRTGRPARDEMGAPRGHFLEPDESGARPASWRRDSAAAILSSLFPRPGRAGQGRPSTSEKGGKIDRLLSVPGLTLRGRVAGGPQRRQQDGVETGWSADASALRPFAAGQEGAERAATGC